MADDADQDEHEREQMAMLLQQASRRWRRRRRQRERDTRQIKGQLLALRLLRAKREGGAEQGQDSGAGTSIAETQPDQAARATLAFQDAEESASARAIARSILQVEEEGGQWWSAFSRPPARMHAQSNLLSGSREAGGTRNAKQRRYLEWIRSVHSAKEAELRLPARGGGTTRYQPEWNNGDYGSPYSTFWPRRATSTNVNLEHIVCSEWLRTTEARVIEAGLPRQDVTVTTLANLNENSSRNDRPLSCFGRQADAQNSRLYTPDEVTDAKVTRLATATCHGVLLYPFVAEENKQSGSRKVAGTFGVSEYARRLDGLKSAALKQSSAFARRVALVNAARHRWHNPLVLRPSLLRQPRYASLLEMRLRGGRSREDPTRLDCGLAMLVDSMLSSSVEDAPL
jgi:hypothetical protein